MLRFVPILLALAALTITGCARKNTTEISIDEPAPVAEQPPAGLSPASDPYGGAYEPLPGAPAADDTAGPAPLPAPREDEVLAPASGRTYVVKKGDTLYSLARRFYNDQSKWRTIYEANRTRLRNPNTLPVGTKLIIP